MLWQYDSQDWQVGVTPDVTSEAVDHEYQLMIDDAKKGMFNSVGFSFFCPMVPSFRIVL